MNEYEEMEISHKIWFLIGIFWLYRIPYANVHGKHFWAL